MRFSQKKKSNIFDFSYTIIIYIIKTAYAEGQKTTFGGVFLRKNGRKH